MNARSNLCYLTLRSCCFTFKGYITHCFSICSDGCKTTRLNDCLDRNSLSFNQEDYFKGKDSAMALVNLILYLLNTYLNFKVYFFSYYSLLRNL